MTGSMTRSLPDDPILIHAYLDGELDPVDALEVQRRIANDPALAAECERIEAVRKAMREKLVREAPPAALRTRIEAAIGTRRAMAPPSWRTLAASVAAAAVLASGATWLALDRYRSDPDASFVVAAHVRGLMAPSTTDVASSETHTIKPWFAGRIPQAPRVVDLASAGFPLAGARVDVIGRNPAPTLIYMRRKHVISVIAVAAPETPDTAPRRSTLEGYNVIQWTAAGVTYWAVSDLNPRELQEFVGLFRGT